MNDVVVVEKIAQWQRLKRLVLDSVSSPITRRVYNMALDEFLAWFQLEPRPGGFCKATVSAWRASLEARKLGSSSIIIRMSAIRKLAAEAADNGLIAPELAAGISRVKSAKSVGVRSGNWLSLRQAQTLLNAPDATTTKGLRDRAVLAVLLGCGLRRSEVSALTFAHVQQRDDRWCIVDLRQARSYSHDAYARMDEKRHRRLGVGGKYPRWAHLSTDQPRCHYCRRTSWRKGRLANAQTVCRNGRRTTDHSA